MSSTREAKVILITGCSSGIGQHCARRLRETGWRVFATARKPEDIEALKEAGCEALYLDYADGDSIRKAFAAVITATGGRLDALFNNGAYAQAGAVEDISTDLLRAQFEANFFGWHELTRLAVPVMRAQGSGRIVHCSSILGLIPYRWRGAYVASKYALEGLMSTLRLELRGSGIHVALIEPGPIRSRFSVNALAQFRASIDPATSMHKDAYVRHIAKLEAGGGVNRYRLGPEAVYAKLAHTLNSPKPKAHYPVTVPAHFMAWFRSILPQARLDAMLMRSD